MLLNFLVDAVPELGAWVVGVGVCFVGVGWMDGELASRRWRPWTAHVAR